MNSILVTYDLIKRKDYPELYKALDSYNSTWHCLDSVWIIKTEKTAADVAKELAAHIDNDDKLITFGVSNLSASWTVSFSQTCKDWLKNNL